MEKEKPYKCDVCGKRYKNLNGLKYVSISRSELFILLLTVTAQTTLTALQSRNEAQWPPPSSRPQQYQRRHQRQRPRSPRHRRRRHALTSLQDAYNITPFSELRPEKHFLHGVDGFLALFPLGPFIMHLRGVTNEITRYPRAAAPRSRAGDATIKVEALTLRPNGLLHHKHTLAQRVLIENSLLPRLGL